MNAPPIALILAGPNGAGKTTVSSVFVGPHVEFVNAKDKSVIAYSDMTPDQLPDTFAIATTLDIKGE